MKGIVSLEIILLGIALFFFAVILGGIPYSKACESVSQHSSGFVQFDDGQPVCYYYEETCYYGVCSRNKVMWGPLPDEAKEWIKETTEPKQFCRNVMGCHKNE